MIFYKYKIVWDISFLDCEGYLKFNRVDFSKLLTKEIFSESGSSAEFVDADVVCVNAIKAMYVIFHQVDFAFASGFQESLRKQK